jgi:hypothetical protein
LVCNPYSCQLTTCLKSISPEEVMLELLDLLKTKEPSQIENLKSHWIKASMTIGFYCNSQEMFKQLKPYIDLARKEGVRVFLLSTSKKISYQNCIETLHVPTVFQLFKTVIKRDINGLFIGGKKSLFWSLFRQLTGPFMYVPSFIFYKKSFYLYEFVAHIKEEMRMVYSAND